MSNIGPRSADEVFEFIAQADSQTYSMSEVAMVLNVSKKVAWVRLTRLRDDSMIDRTQGDERHTDSWSITEAGLE